MTLLQWKPQDYILSSWIREEVAHQRLSTPEGQDLLTEFMRKTGIAYLSVAAAANTGVTSASGLTCPNCSSTDSTLGSPTRAVVCTI